MTVLIIKGIINKTEGQILSADSPINPMRAIRLEKTRQVIKVLALVTTIILSLLEEVNSDLDIEVKDFGPGYWINPLNDGWIKTRVYVSNGNSDLPSDLLEKVVVRLNKKSLKSNIEIYIK